MRLGNPLRSEDAAFRVLLLVVAVAAVVVLVALVARAVAAQSRPLYQGHVSRLGIGKSREGSQGAGWQTVFHERARGRVRYRVCVTHEENRRSRCWRRTTRADGSSVVLVARFVNDRGGPGPWRATWHVRGRRVARWDFVVRSEARDDPQAAGRMFWPGRKTLSGS